MCTSKEFQLRKQIESSYRRNRRNNIAVTRSIKLFGVRFFFSATANVQKSRQISALINRVQNGYGILSRKVTDLKINSADIAMFGVGGLIMLTLVIGAAIAIIGG